MTARPAPRGHRDGREARPGPDCARCESDVWRFRIVEGGPFDGYLRAECCVCGCWFEMAPALRRPGDLWPERGRVLVTGQAGLFDGRGAVCVAG